MESRKIFLDSDCSKTLTCDINICVKRFLVKFQANLTVTLRNMINIRKVAIFVFIKAKENIIWP
jgi:hypothetical protein